MDQYEDLKNFTEKTQLKSLRLVDFTKQNREFNHGKWAIVNQLEAKNHINAQHRPATVPPENRTINLNTLQQSQLADADLQQSHAISAEQAQGNPLSQAQLHQRPNSHSPSEVAKSPLFQAMERSPPGIAPQPLEQPQTEKAESQTAAPLFQSHRVPQDSFAPASRSTLASSPLFDTLVQPSPDVPASQSSQGSKLFARDLSLFQSPANAQPLSDAQPTAAVNNGVFSHLFVQPEQDVSHQDKETPLQPLLKRIATCR